MEEAFGKVQKRVWNTQTYSDLFLQDTLDRAFQTHYLIVRFGLGFYRILMNNNVLSLRSYSKTKFQISTWNLARKQVSMSMVYYKNFISLESSCFEVEILGVVGNIRAMLKHHLYQYHMIGTIKRPEHFVIHYSRWSLFRYQALRQNS